ncbi:MAG: S8 family serine peptidase [Clostridia bacterium]|nr:S8 family serine peptidase [Clostridia bacterium]
MIKKAFLVLFCFFVFAGAAYAQEDDERYIVKIRETADFSLLSDFSQSLGDELDSNLYITDDLSAIKDLESAGMVEYYEEDANLTLFESPYNDTYYSYQWNLAMTDVLRARNVTAGSNAVKVAVIDSGVDTTNPDLTNVAAGRHYSVSNSTISIDSDTMDTYGHGTAVSGIICAKTNNSQGISGIADGITLIPLKIFTTGNDGSLSAMVKAIYDAVDVYGCKVINISAGISTNYSSLADAINYAYSKGVIVVAAAGNDGTSTLNYPAAYSTVVGVGAVSSTGTVADYSQKNSSVWVTAPGTLVPSTISATYSMSLSKIADYYAKVSGTSFSAPHVSALASLVASYKPNVTPDEFMQMLKETSTDLGASGYDTSYGYGLIDMYAALDYFADEIVFSNISAGSSSISRSIYNLTDSTLSGSVVTAFYASDGTLADINIQAVNIAGGSSIEVAVPISVSDCSKIVQFIWDGFGTMKPLADSAAVVQ